MSLTVKWIIQLTNCLFIFFFYIVALAAFAKSDSEEEKFCAQQICASTDDRRPVCGSNGKTYINQSVLGCRIKCFEKHYGKFF